MWVPCFWLRDETGTPNFTITKTCCRAPTEQQKQKVVQMFCDKASVQTPEELKELVTPPQSATCALITNVAECRG
jgi:hypothetical protein